MHDGAVSGTQMMLISEDTHIAVLPTRHIMHRQKVCKHMSFGASTPCKQEAQTRRLSIPLQMMQVLPTS
jgi:hypothetical protein